MFPPQRKAPWTPLTSAPRTEPRFGNSAAAAASLKGKAVALIDGPPPPPPPPLGSLASESVGRGLESGNVDDWRRFKEAGFLDESAMEKKDREALLDKVSRLEKELFHYQYNMGLLLIEKNGLVSKNEELGQVIAESQEILKREQAAHLIAISEAENRECNLKNALNIEKKCVADLERALCDMREEHSKVKDTSKTTLADVNSQMEVLEKKRKELEAKSESVNAKLADIDRKTFELDKKLKDLETCENILRMERLTLTQEREAHESSFRRQKEDLLEWERKLQEAEQRLCESRRTITEREEKLHETENISKEKETTLAELQRKIDLANATLRKMEDDIKNQSTELNIKEKKAEAMRCDLETREKQLKEKEDRLDIREKVELQKLLSEQKTMLDAKMHEFELEMMQKRKSLEEEVESKKKAVAQREVEINHLEAKLGKREQALEKKLERVKEKEKDVDIKVKDFKEQEKCLKAEDKRLQAEKAQLKAEEEHLEDLKEEIEALKAELRKQELQIEEERKKLENVEVERLEYLRLQKNLKQEMENVRRQNELIEKEAEELKLEKEKFERDWEALDEKRATVESELKMLSEAKANFEKLRNSEEERLKKMKTEVEEYIQQESESIRLEKESFDATMKHEKLMLSQKAETECGLMLQDFEQQREKLEKEMQKKHSEWGNLVQEKERAFEEMRSREMKTISHLKEDAMKRREEMESERHRLEKEKLEVELNKKQLEETSIDISKDIQALDSLSKKLKGQREQLVSERAQFTAFIEKIKSCQNCADSVQEFLHKDLHLPTLGGSSDLRKFPRLDHKEAMDELSPFGEPSKKKSAPGISKNSSELGGQINILRKCASLIKSLSPTQGRHTNDPHNAAYQRPAENEEADTFLQRSDEAIAGTQTAASDNPRESFLKNPESDVNVREENFENALSVDDSNIDSEAQSIQESEVSDLKSGRPKRGRKRGGGLHRTRTIKAAVEDAKAILGEKTNTVPATSARKRTRSQASRMTEGEQDAEVIEGKADSVTTDGRRKRRQTAAPALATPGQRRYNLRRHTAGGTTTEGNQSSGGNTKNDGAKEQTALNTDDAPAQSLDVSVNHDRNMNLMQVSTTRSVEFSSEKIIVVGTTAKVVESKVGATKSAENTMLSEEARPAEDTLLSEGTSEYVRKDNNINTFNEIQEEDNGEAGEENDDDFDEDDDNDDDDDDDNHPGQASIGKQLWKILTK